MFADLFFIAICYIFDEAISVLFPASFIADGICLVSSLGFCGLIITMRKYDTFSATMLAAICGFLYAILFNSNYIIMPLIYALCILLLHFWQRHVGESIIESLFLGIIFTFVKDFLLYGTMYLLQVTNLNIEYFMKSIEAPSIILNTVTFLICILFIRMKDDYLERKALQIKAEEHLGWSVFKGRK